MTKETKESNNKETLLVRIRTNNSTDKKTEDNNSNKTEAVAATFLVVNNHKTLRETRET